MTRSSPRWYPVGGSVRGSSHVATGTANQDAWRATEPDAVAVGVVADGHGSQKSCRSDAGAQIAATLGVEVIEPLARTAATSAELEHALRDLAAPQIVARWRDCVRDDAADHPFSEAERTAVGASTIDAAVTRLAHGTTLVAVCGTPSSVGLLAIGDGDGVVVGIDGSSVSRPLPDDPANVAHITSSLSQSDPIRAVRVAVVDLETQPLRLAWASTDGFRGAFVDPEWWLQGGIDLSERASRLRPHEIADRIPDWLGEPADVAGDDATMVILLADPAPGPRED